MQIFVLIDVLRHVTKKDITEYCAIGQKSQIMWVLKWVSENNQKQPPELFYKKRYS